MYLELAVLAVFTFGYALISGRNVKRYLVAGVVLLQGCTTLGPDYAEPEVAWLHEWESTLYGQVESSSVASTEEEDLTFWWHAFKDPVLNELIETARNENPSLRIAGLRIAESRAQLGIATGSQYPQVQQVSGSVARVDRWTTEGDASGDHDNFNNYDLGFNVGWEMDFWGRYRRSIESADAAFFASVTNQQNVQVLLSAQVAQAYFSYRTIARQIDIAIGNAELQSRSLEITRYLYDSGQESELDLQQAKTQYLATLATIPALEINLRKFNNALAALLGRAPELLPELAGETQNLPALEDVMIHEIPARVLMRRPDIRTAAWQVAAQSAQIGVARTDLYPSISLFGSIGWSGNSLNATTDTATLGIGPAFSWNVFNYGRIENNVRVQDARLQQVIESYQNVTLQAAREIDDAAISVIKTREQGDILAQSVAAAERSLKLSTQRYREGYSGFQRVLDAQRALAAQSNNYIASQGAHIGSVIAFYKALGGGWQVASLEQAIPAETREIMQQRTDWGGLLEAPLSSPPSR